MTALASIAYMQGFRAGQIAAQGNNAKVFAAIEMQPGMTGTEIGKTLSINPASVRTALRRLKKRGEIECVGKQWFPEGSSS